MGAKMVEFNGWDMPVEYPASIGCGIVAEHMAVRKGVGIFDVSHMGDIRLAGREALAAVQHISMNDARAARGGGRENFRVFFPPGDPWGEGVAPPRPAGEKPLLKKRGGPEK